MHCLYGYICKEKELKDAGLSVKFLSLPQGFAIFDTLSDEDSCAIVSNGEALILPKNIDNLAHIQTDYFGGSGEQFATLVLEGKAVNVESVESPINEALSKLGVVKDEGVDEFDTLHLGRYRSNSDLWENEKSI